MIPVRNENGIDIKSMSIRRRNHQIDRFDIDFIVISHWDVREREKIAKEIEKSESIRKKHRTLKTGRIEDSMP